VPQLSCSGNSLIQKTRAGSRYAADHTIVKVGVLFAITLDAARFNLRRRVNHHAGSPLLHRLSPVYKASFLYWNNMCVFAFADSMSLDS